MFKEIILISLKARKTETSEKNFTMIRKKVGKYLGVFGFSEDFPSNSIDFLFFFCF